MTTAWILASATLSSASSVSDRPPLSLHALFVAVGCPPHKVGVRDNVCTYPVHVGKCPASVSAAIRVFRFSSSLLVTELEKDADGKDVCSPLFLRVLINVLDLSLSSKVKEMKWW